MKKILIKGNNFFDLYFEKLAFLLGFVWSRLAFIVGLD